MSDPSRLIAQPLTTLTRRPKQRAPVAAAAALAAEHGVRAIVVGLPLTEAGDEGDAARDARAFGDALAARTHLPVHYQDERMTTAHALKSARRAGVKDADSRARIDQMAAVGILQAWLDRESAAQRHGGTAGPERA